MRIAVTGSMSGSKLLMVKRTHQQFAAQGLVLGSVVLGLVPLLWFAISRGGLGAFQLDAGVWNVLLFTLEQAFLSTLLSVVPGLFIARALARQDFPGHAWLLRLFAVPTALPAIVVVLALTSIYGGTRLLGGWIELYGLGGILLAHVFFNLPLAVRLFYEASEHIAAENFRLSAQLSFTDGELFRHVEWPVLRNVVPRVSALIFLLCAASFVIVLTLGGPSATTLEVAIYQSLRLDFDIGRALTLAIIQIVLCLALVGLSGQVMLQQVTHAGNQLFQRRYDGQGFMGRVIDYLLIALGALLVLPPLIALLSSGLMQLQITQQVLSAAAFSFGIGLASACVALILALNIAQQSDWLSQGLVLSALIVPPAVMATGWFILLQNFSDSTWVVVCTIIALNALMALPFAVSILAPAFERNRKKHDRLCAQLALSGWQKLRQIDLLLMTRPLAQAFLLAFILSIGDLTAITLLGNQGIVTLPSLIQIQMGHYRGNDAAGTAVLLAILSLACAWAAQKFGDQNDPD
jgi:thiamine transport system permease protein